MGEVASLVAHDLYRFFHADQIGEGLDPIPTITRG